MSDKGEVMEWVETTKEAIIEECVLANGNSSAGKAFTFLYC